MKLNELTLARAVKLLKKKQISHAELYEDTLIAIERKNGILNAYLSVDRHAGEKARALLGTPLAGVPIAVKDNFLTLGVATTASSNILKGYIPPYESTITTMLKKSGGVIMGKTNMDAWAHGSSTETSDFGPTKNPRNTAYLPGGSSGGSAAAVAANLCIGALGSETAGSIRQPAAWCGVVGLKPTYGRTSRYGVVAMASSTDTPGPMGKTVQDCSMVFNAISGQDAYNATTSAAPVPDLTKYLAKGVKGMKIGMCYVDHHALINTPAANAVIAAGKVFEQLGAHVELIPVANDVRAKHMFNPDYAIGVYTVIQRGEVSSNLARYDGVRYGAGRDVFGAEAKRRIMLGTFTLSHGFADKYYVRAQQVRSLIIQNFHELFGEYDLLIAPTSPGYAQKIGASLDNPMYGELEDMLLEASSIAGLPGISVPCFRDSTSNLFMGLNIMGNLWQEEKMVQAAYAYEQATDWNEWAKET